MIRYSLKCTEGHGFDSWFANADAYGVQQEKGLVGCPVCGSTRIDKDLMAPSVRPGRKASVAGASVSGTSVSGASIAGPADGTAPPANRSAPDLTTPATELEVAIAALRRHIAERSDDVGANFVAEARRMHAGEVPERAIHGQARLEEARQLLEDGIPVAPLPFLPPRKVN